MIKTGKILSIIMWVLVIISAVLVVSLIANINTDNLADPVMANWINVNLTWAYIMVAVAAGIILIFGLYHMVTEKKSLISGLAVFGFFVVIVGIAYLLASDEFPQFIGVDKFVENGTLTHRVSKLIGMGLNTTYILFIIAVVSIVWSSVTRLFK